MIRDGAARRASGASRELAPLELFEPHRGREWPFFLDRAGAASFAASRPFSQIVVEADGRVREWSRGAWRECGDHPVDAVAAFIESSHALPCSLPPEFAAAALPRTVGYLAYELGAYVEDVPVAGRDPAGAPLVVLSTYERVDAWAPGAPAPVTIEFEDAGKRAGAAPPPLSRPVPMRVAAPPARALARYRRGFTRILTAIREGEIYQANLSRRIDLPFADDPLEAYARLRRVQPVAQGAYLDLGARRFLSNSPECFLRVRGDTIETFPIKGTRARSFGSHDGRSKGAERAMEIEERAALASDREERAALVADPKERAEHVMIVDLERNDLGRVCVAGSVTVPRYAYVESYATVHHLVSAVRGTLRANATAADVLRATFPGGSITGAPKVRAMEIIAEVEPEGRGVYTGAIGCFNGARQAELSVAIRTAVVGDGRIQYSAGGGIVADSRCESEYEETNVKARAFLESLRGAPSAARAAI